MCLYYRTFFFNYYYYNDKNKKKRFQTMLKTLLDDISKGHDL